MDIKNDSSPLMFIQTVSNNIVNNSNQHYFDSRYQVKKVDKFEVVEEKIEVVNNEVSDISTLLNKVKMVEQATKSGMKITCEVCLNDNEMLYGELLYHNDNSFYLNDILLNFVDVVEINIQTIKIA